MRYSSWFCALCLLAPAALLGCAAGEHLTTAPALQTAAADACPACDPAAHAKVAAAPSSHAECLVCKHNADLACVDVKVKPDTPRAEYAGRTYYFCSDECRNEFVKHPEKFATKSQ